MTVSNTANEWPHVGNGVTTSWAYGNKIFDASDLEIYIDAVPQPSGYTVTNVGNQDGGQVVFDTAPAVDADIVFVRNVPDLQPTKYPEMGKFPSSAHEAGLDRRTIVSQQQAAKITRSVQRPVTSTEAYSLDWPDGATTPAKFLIVDISGGIQLSDGVADVVVSAAMTPVVQAATLEAGRSALGTIGPDTNGQAIDFSEGSDVASAAAPDVWATDGNTVHITGTATITDFADAPRVGASRWVIFDRALTLTHGSGITLPGAANITTAAGDAALVYADAVDAFRVLFYTKADGAAVSAGGCYLSKQVFTSSGTWTKPAGVNTVKVTVIGPGGGGGSPSSGGGAAGAGGGGTAIKWIDVSEISSETVTVGAPGTVLVANDGKNGGTSSFGAHCSATGGRGGEMGVNGSAGGVGGSGSGGDINLDGGDGASGRDAHATFAQSGGDSFMGGGGSGAPDAGGANGSDGGNYGGGGGGANDRPHIGGVGGSVDLIVEPGAANDRPHIGGVGGALGIHPGLLLANDRPHISGVGGPGIVMVEEYS